MPLSDPPARPGDRAPLVRIPLVSHLRNSTGQDRRRDLIAGLTVGVMLIPQGMAYALIAGLPPVHGLHAALVPLIAYALLGSSRQLAVGPVAMVSLLVAAGVAPLAEGDAARYLALSLALAALVGALQLAMGLMRLGFMVNLLSHPVLTGFTSAAAIIIGTSQLPNLMGVQIPRGENPLSVLAGAFGAVPDANLITVLVGTGAIVVTLATRRLLPGVPAPMLVVALGTAATALLHLDRLGVQVVGTVPAGLPVLSVPLASRSDLWALAPIGAAIALVGFMESIAVAKTYASRHRYDVDANQELKALGVANLAGSLFQAFPVTGGFSRTAVNDQAGAHSQLASIVSAGVIAVTLIALTPLFYYLPKAVLAAIIVVAVASLVDVKGARQLWRVDRRDFGLMTATFAATLALGIEEGIVAGVLLSLVVLIDQISRPHTAVLGQDPATRQFRDARRGRSVSLPPSVVVFRMDASLFYGNAEYFRERVKEAVGERHGVTALVIDAYPINRIDSTGLHTLQRLVHESTLEGVHVFLAGLKGPVYDKLQRAGILDLLGSGRIFDEIGRAVDAATSSAGIGETSTDPAQTG